MSVFQNGIIPRDLAADDPIVKSAEVESSDCFERLFNGGLSGSHLKWTFSCWIKRERLNAGYPTYVSEKAQHIFSADNGVDDQYTTLFFKADSIGCWHQTGYYNTGFRLVSKAKFRDTASWYHILWTYDSENSAYITNIYVNGKWINEWDSASSAAGSSATPWINRNIHHDILRGDPSGGGRIGTGYQWYVEPSYAYISDIYLIDGEELSPSDFIRTDNAGQIIPKAYDTSSTSGNSFHINHLDRVHDAPLLVQSMFPNTSTQFFNSGSGAHVVTANNGTQHKTTVGTPFGTGSAMYFDGDAAIWTDWAALNVGTGDFTIHWWVYHTSFSGYTTTLDTGYNAANTILMQTGSGSGITSLYMNGGYIGTESSACPTGEWVFYELRRYYDSSALEYVVKLTRNGTAVITQDSTTYSNVGISIGNSSKKVAFGTSYNHSQQVHGMVGYLYDFRILHSNTPISVPTAPFEEELLIVGGDTSGNGNHFTVGGTIHATNDITDDSPSKGLNHCVLNGLHPIVETWSSGVKTEGVGLSDGMLTSTVPAIGTFDAMDHNSYWEVQRFLVGYGANLGVTSNNNVLSTVLIDTAETIGFRLSTAGALDYTDDGTSWTSVATGLTGPQFPYVSGNYTRSNFGQHPYAYTPPSGYTSLTTGNMSTPVIDDPTKHFDIKTFSGSGANTFGNGGMQPDLCWFKDRTSTASHKLVDSVRGVQKSLESDTEDAEATESTGLTAFGSDGFTVGADSSYSGDMVAWCWKAGTTTYANTSYNPTADFSIMTWTGDAGEEDGDDGHLDSSQDILHRLSGAPEFIMAACRTQNGASQNYTDAGGFYVWHQNGGASLGAADHLLTLSDASGSRFCTASGSNGISGPFSAVDSTKISFNNGEADNDDHYYLNYGGNTDTMEMGSEVDPDDYVAYAWRGVKGFSKFGVYSGYLENFVTLGFAPAFLMVKYITSSTGYWKIIDAVRDADSQGSTNAYNPRTNFLEPSANHAEATYTAANEGFQFSSNGFKAVGTDTGKGGSTGAYLYAAWAAAPDGVTEHLKTNSGV